ncbi:hypothetical protein A6A04_20370 [Paramagnetospirillum marisnigri]|uniref:Uncharacterized protein n=1 Tax=Paramagnetospirillum marisnigri TaxID=1285242 RepID=A0A178MH19_9PROT|nr:hypothetical protein [Paramagnetospirillum marisnigri]OAN47437.1 hypothetical protein A6A04_20370 [Paramagnetospirillum marisnigri]
MALLACWAPMPLYLVAIACFGLPHVIWEMTWIKRTAGDRLPRWWWGGLAAILSVQASARLAFAAGKIGHSVAGLADLLTLALAFAMVATLPGIRDGWRPTRTALVALAGAVALATIGVAGAPEAMAALLVALSVAHNFTPIGLERLGRPSGDPWSGLRWMMALPLLLLAVPQLPQPEVFGVLPAWFPGELSWLKGQPVIASLNLFPALVLAQCLHYVAVLRILPRRFGAEWRRGGWWGPAMAAAAVMVMGFLWSFPDARRLYGVAAGVHAWIEWPILLCLIGGVLGDAQPSSACRNHALR